jgi:hypothetical protein
MSLRILGLVPLLAALAAPALAQPTIDGSIAGDAYGPAVSVQAVQTGFGDNLSELDAAYCISDGIRFYLALTGNLEDNFNKIEIFIDSRAGGESTLSGLPGNDGSGSMAGMGFDVGFDADFHIIVRHGFSGGDRFDLDFAELGTANFSSYGDVFGGTQEGSGATGTGLNAQPIEVGFDNSNAGGVTDGSGAANQAAALAVQTGLELGIALSDLGYAGGDIRICAFVNNANHDYASNQFLGPLTPPQGNLGSDGNGNFTGSITFDLGDFAGDQYFVCTEGVIPVKPTTWSRIKSVYR